jgi:hypothetical protein
MTSVFLDESGFTGSNLCDIEQPVFALASHCIGEEESRELKARFFGEFRGPDVKYSKLAKRPAGKEMILRFMAYLRERRQDTQIAFAHKPYVLLCKGVDWIVEPHLRRQGIDLYEQGGNLALSNMMHFVTLGLAGKDYYARLLGELQTLFREPGRRTFVRLCDVLAEKTGMPNAPKSGPLAETLGHFYFPLLLTHPDDAQALGADALEFAFSLTICMMHRWKQRLGAGMRLIHDHTSAMARKRRYWDALMSSDAPADMIGYDRRTIEFPIGITETQFVPSERFAGIQLADILAGAVSECMANKLVREQDREPFVRQLWDHFEGWDIAAHIWPEDKFTPKDLGTDGPAASNGIDYVSRIFDDVDKNAGEPAG